MDIFGSPKLHFWRLNALFYFRRVGSWEGNASANTVKFTYFILSYEAPLGHSIILLYTNIHKCCVSPVGCWWRGWGWFERWGMRTTHYIIPNKTLLSCLGTWGSCKMSIYNESANPIHTRFAGKFSHLYNKGLSWLLHLYKDLIF